MAHACPVRLSVTFYSLNNSLSCHIPNYCRNFPQFQTWLAMQWEMKLQLKKIKFKTLLGMWNYLDEPLDSVLCIKANPQHRQMV